MNVFISEQAETDLLQIYRYLAARNPAAAESMVQQIDRRFVNLSQFPFIGRDRSSLAQGMRSLVADIYLIFYRVEPEHVVIVRVLDGRRDIDAEFQR
jgi:toxin ParE1/3/4